MPFIISLATEGRKWKEQSISRSQVLRVNAPVRQQAPELCLVQLDPTVGSEIRKARPCVVVSPDEMDRHIRTVIVAPLTSQGRAYPTRVPCTVEGREGQIVLDQIRTVDKARLVRPMGQLEARTQQAALAELFAA